MVSLPGGPSWYPKVALITLFVAFFIYLVSFGSHHWCKTNESKVDAREHIGLWRYCSYPYGGGQVCNDFIDIIVGDWLKAAQSFMTLALFTFLGALGVQFIVAFVEDFARDLRIMGAAIAVTGVTALFLLIGIATMGEKCHEYFENKQEAWEDVREFDWSFYLAITSLLLTTASLVLLIIEVVFGDDDKGY